MEVRKISLEDYKMFQDKDWTLEGEISLQCSLLQRNDSLCGIFLLKLSAETQSKFNMMAKRSVCLYSIVFQDEQ